ncbi:MAG: Flp pilus assembly complex ATPase component TadA [Lachnospiraceae bacterium]|nr:Flp pilus assembly complex ATPase component TadA [Lachnospiraceae bacterium]
MKVNKVSYDALLGMYTKESENSKFLFDVRDKKRSKEEFREKLIADAVKYFPNDNAEDLADAIINNVLGYNIITSLIYDKEITDIKLYDYNHITIKKNGQRMSSDVTFDSEEEYDRFVSGVITRNKVNTSTQNAIQRFVDDSSIDGCILRFTLYTPFLTSDKKFKLVIRKSLLDFPEMEDLVNAKMLTPQMSDYLINQWTKGSILICGANACGKTTLLNALKERIPDNRSVLVIQQADELTTKRHPDMMFLHSFEGVGENAVRYDLKDLSIAGLTSDVDIFIIGEIKGAEASYLLNASYTGSQARSR